MLRANITPPPHPSCLAPEYWIYIGTGDGGGGQACIGVAAIDTIGSGGLVILGNGKCDGRMAESFNGFGVGLTCWLGCCLFLDVLFYPVTVQ